MDWKKATRIHTMLDAQEAFDAKYGNTRYMLPDRVHIATNKDIVESGDLNGTATYQLHNEASKRALEDVMRRIKQKEDGAKMRNEAVANYHRLQPWDVIRGPTPFFQVLSQGMPHSGAGMSGGVIHTPVGTKLLHKAIQQRVGDLNRLQTASIDSAVPAINNNLNRLDMSEIKTDDAQMIDVNVGIQLIAESLLSFMSVIPAGEETYNVRGEDVKNATKTIAKLLPGLLVAMDNKDIADLKMQIAHLDSLHLDVVTQLIGNRANQQFQRRFTGQFYSFLISIGDFIARTAILLDIILKGVPTEGRARVPFESLSPMDRQTIIKSAVKQLNYDQPYGSIANVLKRMEAFVKADDEEALQYYEAVANAVQHLRPAMSEDRDEDDRDSVIAEARSNVSQTTLPYAGPRAIPEFYVGYDEGDEEAFAREEAQAEASEIAERRLAPAGAIDQDYLVFGGPDQEQAPVEEEGEEEEAEAEAEAESAPASASSRAKRTPKKDLALLTKPISEWSADKIPLESQVGTEYLYKLARRLNEEDGAKIKVDLRTSGKSVREGIRRHLINKGQRGKGKPKKAKGKHYADLLGKLGKL